MYALVLKKCLPKLPATLWTPIKLDAQGVQYLARQVHLLHGLHIVLSLDQILPINSWEFLKTCPGNKDKAHHLGLSENSVSETLPQNHPKP